MSDDFLKTLGWYELSRLNRFVVEHRATIVEDVIAEVRRRGLSPTLFTAAERDAKIDELVRKGVPLGIMAQP